MTNVIHLFAFAATSSPTSLVEPRKQILIKNAKPKRNRAVELTAEAGRLAQAIKMLSTIQGETSDIFQHLTHRSEVELTQNFKKAVELLSRFAKELKLDDDKVDNRNSESARG